MYAHIILFLFLFQENVEFELNTEKIRKVLIHIAKTRKITLDKLKKRLVQLRKLRVRKRVKTAMVTLTMLKQIYLSQLDDEIPIEKCDVLKKYLYLPKYKKYSGGKESPGKKPLSLLSSEPSSKIEMTRYEDMQYLIPLRSPPPSQLFEQDKSIQIISDVLRLKLYEEEQSMETEGVPKGGGIRSETETEGGGTDECERSWKIFSTFNKYVSKNPESEFSRSDSIQTYSKVMDQTSNKPKKEIHAGFIFEGYLTMDGGDRRYKYARPSLPKVTHHFETSDIVKIGTKAHSVNEVFSSDTPSSQSNISAYKSKRIIEVFNSYHDFYHLRENKSANVINGKTPNNATEDSVNESGSSLSQSRSKKRYKRRAEIAPYAFDGKHKKKNFLISVTKKTKNRRQDTTSNLKTINTDSRTLPDTTSQDQNTLVTDRDIIKDFLMYFCRFSRQNLNRPRPRFKRQKIPSNLVRFKDPRLEKTPPPLKKNLPIINDPEIKDLINKKLGKLILKMFPSFKKEKKKRKMFFVRAGEPPVLAVNGYPVFIFLRNILKIINPWPKEHIIESRVPESRPSEVEPKSTKAMDRGFLENLNPLERTSKSKLLEQSSEKITTRSKLISKYSFQKGEKEVKIRVLIYRIQCLVSVLSKCMNKVKSERHIILHEVAKLVRHYNKRVEETKRKKKRRRENKEVVSVANSCKLQKPKKEIGFKKKKVIRYEVDPAISSRLPDKLFNNFDEMMSLFLQKYKRQEDLTNSPNQNYVCNIDEEDFVFEGTLHPCIYFADDLLDELDCDVAYSGVVFPECSSSDESDPELLKLSGLVWDDFNLGALIYIEMFLKNKKENRKYIGLPPGITKIFIKDVKDAIKKKTDMFCNLKTSILLDLLTGKPCLRKDSRLIDINNFDKRALDKLSLGELVYVWRNLKITDKTLVDPEAIKLKIARILLYEKERNIHNFVSRFLAATSLGRKGTGMYSLIRKALIDHLLQMAELVPPLKCQRCGEFNKLSLFYNPELAFIALNAAKNIIHRSFNQLGELVTALYRKKIKNNMEGKLYEEPFDGYLYSIFTQKCPFLKQLLYLIFNRNLKYRRRTSAQVNKLIQHRNLRRKRRLRKRKCHKKIGKNMNQDKLSFIMQSHRSNRKPIKSFIDIMDCIHTGQSHKLAHYQKPKVIRRKHRRKKHVKRKGFFPTKGHKKIKHGPPLKSMEFFFQPVQTRKKFFQDLNTSSQAHETRRRRMIKKRPKGLQNISEDLNLRPSVSDSQLTTDTNILTKTLYKMFSGAETTKYFSQKERRELIDFLISLRPIDINEESFLTKENLTNKIAEEKRRHHFHFPLGQSKYTFMPKRKGIKYKIRVLKKIIAKVYFIFKNKPFLRTVKIALDRLIVLVTTKPDNLVESGDNDRVSSIKPNLSKTDTIPKNESHQSQKKVAKELKKVTLSPIVTEPTYSSLSSLLEKQITEECEPILRECLTLNVPNHLAPDAMDIFSGLICTIIKKQVFDIIMRKLLGKIIINVNKHTPESFRNYRSLVKKFSAIPTKKNTDVDEPDDCTSSILTKKFLLFGVGASNEIGEAVNTFLSAVNVSVKGERSFVSSDQTEPLKEKPEVQKVSKVEHPKKRELVTGRSRYNKTNIKDTKSGGFHSTKDFQGSAISFPESGPKTKHEHKVCIGTEDNGMDIELYLEGGADKNDEIHYIIKELRKCLRKIPKKKLLYRSSIAKKSKHKQKKKRKIIRSRKTQIAKLNIFATKRFSRPCKHLLLSQRAYERFKTKLKVVKQLATLIKDLQHESFLYTNILEKSNSEIKKSFLSTIRSFHRDINYAEYFSPSAIIVQKPIYGLPKAGCQMIPVRKNLSLNKEPRKKNMKRRLCNNKVNYHTKKGNLKNIKKRKKILKFYLAKRKKSFLNYKSQRFTSLKNFNEDNKKKRISILPNIIRGIVAIKDAEMSKLVHWAKQKINYLVSQNHSKCQSKTNKVLLDIFAKNLNKLTMLDNPDMTKITPYEADHKTMGNLQKTNKNQVPNLQNKVDKSIQEKDLILFDNFKKLMKTKTTPTQQSNIPSINKKIIKTEKLLKSKADIILITQKMRDLEKSGAHLNRRLPKVTQKNIRACKKLQYLSAKNIAYWESTYNKINTPMKTKTTGELQPNHVMAGLIEWEKKIRELLNNLEKANTIINEVQDKREQEKMKMEVLFREQKLQKKLRWVIREQRYLISRIKFEGKRKVLLEQHAHYKKFIENLKKKQRLYSSFLQNESRKISRVGALGPATAEQSHNKMLSKIKARKLRKCPSYNYQFERRQECRCPKPTYFHPKKIALLPGIPLFSLLIIVPTK